MSDRVVELFQREDGKWWWHVLGANSSDILSDSGQAYVTRRDALHMAVELNPGLEVVERHGEAEHDDTP